MLAATDTEVAPWYIVPSDDKKAARLNCIAQFLELMPYKKVPREKVKLPKRSEKGAYDDQASLEGRRFVKQNLLIRPMRAPTTELTKKRLSGVSPDPTFRSRGSGLRLYPHSLFVLQPGRRGRRPI